MEVLTAQEAAAFLKLSDRMIRQLADDGAIPSVPINPKAGRKRVHRRFIKADLEHWLIENRENAAAGVDRYNGESA